MINNTDVWSAPTCTFREQENMVKPQIGLDCPKRLALVNPFLGITIPVVGRRNFNQIATLDLLNRFLVGNEKVSDNVAAFDSGSPCYRTNGKPVFSRVLRCSPHMIFDDNGLAFQ